MVLQAAAEHVQSGLFLVVHVSNQHSQRRKNFLDRCGGLDKCSLNCGRGPRFGVVNAYSPWFPLLP